MRKALRDEKEFCRVSSTGKKKKASSRQCKKVKNMLEVTLIDEIMMV